MYRDTILLVDDSGSNRAVLRQIFNNWYNILEAEDGEQAMLLLRQNCDCIAAVLLDIIMPKKDGYEVLQEMGAGGMLKTVPVVVITSMSTSKNEIKALKLGAVDIIEKPYDPIVVSHRVQNIIDLYRHKWHLEDMVSEQFQKLRHSNEMMIDALTSIIETRSMESGQHVLRIRRFTHILMTEYARCNPEQEISPAMIDLVSMASTLHDIGKISIPDAILNKPGRLTPEEFEIMKTHTTVGCKMIESLGGVGDEEYLYYAYNICRYHHERWDGRGYPDGLTGGEIPLCAQIVGIADVYDALTTKRVYKPRYSNEKAASMILGGECGIFSPMLLECFKNVKEDFEALAEQYADGQTVSPEDFQLMHMEMPQQDSAENNELSAFQILQEKYQSLMHYFKAAVMEVDIDNNFYHFVYNPYPELAVLSDEKLSSYDKMRDRLFEELIHPDDLETAKIFESDCNKRLFEDGEKQLGCQYRLLNRSTGEYIRYDVEAIRIEISDDKKRQFIVLWTPSKGEVRDESELSWYDISKTALDGMLGAILRCRNDKALTILDGAESIAGLIGCTVQDIQDVYDNSFLNIIVQEDREVFLEQIKMMRPHDNVFTLEYLMNSKKGKPIWVHDRRRLITDKNGEESFCCLIEDVSLLKRTQERLNVMLERHQVILHKISNILFEWDLSSDIVSFSDNWNSVFGYKLVIDNMSIKVVNNSIIHPDDQYNFENKIVAMMNGSESETFTVRIMRTDGKYKWIEIRAASQFDADKHISKIIGLMLDVTETRSQELAID